MKQKLITFKDFLMGKIHALNTKRNLNSEKYKKLNLILTIIFPFFIACLAETNHHKKISSFLRFFIERPTVMLFNFVISGLIFYTLICIIKKGWLATFIHSLIYMALSTVELFKFGTNGNHLILSDMTLAKNIKSMKSFAYIKITPQLIAYFAIAIIFLCVIFYLNPKYNLKPLRRITSIVGSCIVGASLITVPVFFNGVYSFFNLDTTSASNTFLLNEKFENNSMLAFLLVTASEDFENRLVEPENYSSETIDNILDVEVINADGDFNGGVKPNVIVIMSEAYADFRVFDELDVDDSYYADFDAVGNAGDSGTLISPTYASFTVRSEFELLFGLPVRSINDPNMPQRDLAEREHPTMAQYYSSWGYNTAYVHPFESTFYSRERVYAQFGFDKMIFDADFTVPVERFGTYISDDTIFNQIEKLIVDTENPMYIHTTTMQNHQPYDQGEDPDAEFENYLTWIQHTGEGLTDFLGRLEELDEPTIVFMVGDHFPSLKGGSGVYDQIGINGDNCSVVFEQKYILWNNYGADISFPDEKFSFFYSPYMIMNAIDAPRDSFIQKMNDLFEVTPIYSTNYDSNPDRNEELDILTYDRVIAEEVYSKSDMISAQLAESGEPYEGN